MKHIVHAVALILAAGSLVSSCSKSYRDKRSASEPTAADVVTPPSPQPPPEVPAMSVFVPTGGSQLPKSFGVVTAASGRPVCLTPGTDSTTLLAPTGMSRAFLDNCAGCHGFAGDGRPGFPALRGARDKSEFILTVREGRGGMPAFPAALISDADLDADAMALAKESQPSVALPEGFQDVPLAPLTPIEPVEYEAAMSAGLKAWRTPGETGACASCHGPDGIDLARIGYSNADIFRRAMGQGRTSDEARAVVSMISAQRRRYQIATPCSPTSFRPLQPGGSPLAGSSSDDLDAKLSEQLKTGGLEFDPTKVETADIARALADKVLKLDPSTIRVGIALNKWTSDSVYGSSQRTTAEWIPELPMEPGSAEVEGRWTSAQNQYLENPTAENFWVMYDMVGELGAGRLVTGGVAERLSREKYRSVLVLQHMMRVNDTTFPDLHKAKGLFRFSIWETGQVATVMLRGCAEDRAASQPLACWGYTPKFHAKMGMNQDELLADAQKMVLPWLTTGLIVDPNLQFTENGDAQIQHWHDASRELAGARLPPEHEVYFGLLRLVHAVDAFDTTLPSGHAFEHASVNGCWNTAHAGLVQWTDSTLRALEGRETASTLAVNRMALRLIGAALNKPLASCKEHQGADSMATIVRALGEWGAALQKKVGVDNKKLADEVAAQLK